jgi:hypothetical protein
MSTATKPPRAVPLHRLVRQVVRAMKATKRMTFWDLVIDEEDVAQRISKPLGNGYTEAEAMESAIESLMMSHEDFLGNAVRDQCRMATKKALAQLPNG